MTRRFLFLVASLVLAAAGAAAALAAVQAVDARTYVLRKGDFPAGAKVSASFGEATAAGGTWNYRRGGKPFEISSTAGVFPTVAVARAGFKEVTSDVGPLVARIRLPRYGDEQFATFHVAGGSQLIVRKGRVLWMLELQTFLTRGGVSHELTKAEAIAEYRRFAPTVQRRVGNG
jgi:hypothetical protein